MARVKNFFYALCLFAGCTANFSSAYAADATNCDEFNIDDKASAPLPDSQAVSLPPTQGCVKQSSNGFPIPDPKCTPGAINKTITTSILRDPGFRTSCLRSHATTEQAKAGTYAWYGEHHPTENTGVHQTCELDHLISLELGGADTLDNIWPQCGPSDVVLRERFFKIKDMVENYLAAEVKAGTIKLSDAQQGIARDWTQFLDEAKAACRSGTCKVKQ